MQLKKNCEQCGKEFEPKQWDFKLCNDCFQSQKKSSGGQTARTAHRGGRQEGRGHKSSGRPHTQPLPENLKLKEFYTESGTLKREVFIDTAEGIARQFNAERLTASSIRRFYDKVRATYDKYVQIKDFDRAMESIYGLRRIAHYNQQRQITTRCFTDFIDYYVDLVSKDPKNLKGFKELFMSVIGYMKK